MFHFDCPGCGFQRSAIELMKGNVGESFRLYPPLIPILFMFATLLIYLFKKWDNGYKHLKFLYFLCAGAIVVNYFYKLTLL